ncbi:phasin family protein [Ferrimonas senticii]|uniref:phasin family protein n=1 Tax=Ferrimonas senticii TaxID=394566 RepID=UPI00040DE185|nr:phasin family protein [Ferrimonas senticii]
MSTPIEKLITNDEALARKIWLAGLGAYAKGSRELGQLSDRSRSWLTDLVEQGRAMETDTKTRWKDASSQTTQAVNDKMNEQMQRFTGMDPRQLDDLDAKLEKLAAMVDKLAEMKVAEAKPAAPTKAAAARPRKAAKPAVKPEPKAAPVKPAAAVKPAAVKPKAMAAKPDDTKVS